MKRYVLFHNQFRKYCYLDRLTKMHTDYSYKIIDTMITPDKNTYITTGGIINKVLNDSKEVKSRYILESDIPITPQNYPELLI